MASGKLNIEELTARIGAEWEPVECEVGPAMIERFVQAVDDPNPLWQNDEYARRSKYCGIIAPPTFIAAAGLGKLMDKMLSLPFLGTFIHGKTELECYRPVRPEDVITIMTRISNIRQRQGKMGTMVFITFDIGYRNQKQELVAKCQQTVIGY